MNNYATCTTHATKDNSSYLPKCNHFPQDERCKWPGGEGRRVIGSDVSCLSPPPLPSLPDWWKGDSLAWEERWEFWRMEGGRMEGWVRRGTDWWKERNTAPLYQCKKNKCTEMLFGHCDPLRPLIITRVQILALSQFLPMSGPVQRVSRQHHLQQQQQGPCLLVVHQRLRVQFYFKSTPSTTRLGNYLKSPIEATWEALNKVVISPENHCNQSKWILEKRKSLKKIRKRSRREAVRSCLPTRASDWKWVVEQSDWGK